MKPKPLVELKNFTVPLIIDFSLSRYLALQKCKHPSPGGECQPGLNVHNIKESRAFWPEVSRDVSEASVTLRPLGGDNKAIRSCRGFRGAGETECEDRDCVDRPPGGG